MQVNDERKKMVQSYTLSRLTLLELMGVLAVLGLLVTWVMRSFFG